VTTFEYKGRKVELTQDNSGFWHYSIDGRPRVGGYCTDIGARDWAKLTIDMNLDALDAEEPKLDLIFGRFGRPAPPAPDAKF
jgi:hypothetical protein